jgi:hypothetical protein
MAQSAERTRRIAEATRDLRGGLIFEVESSQRFILALACRRRLSEELPAFCYAIWFSDVHKILMSHAESGVKPSLERRRENINKVLIYKALSQFNRESGNFL